MTNVCVCAIFTVVMMFLFILFFSVGHTLHSRLYLNKLFSQAAPQNKITSTLGIKLLDKLLRQTMVPDQTINNLKL